VRSLRDLSGRFWSWYRRHYVATLVVTTALFLLQLFHLYWLFTDVVLKRLTGRSYFAFPAGGLVLYVLIDYLEIPTHLSAMVMYFYEFRRGIRLKSLLFFVLLQLHWVHLLWITDDVVVNTFTAHTLLTWGGFAAWVAIGIDYIEVPIIVDRLRQVYLERETIWRRLRTRFAGARPAPAARATKRRAAAG
jgi:hypothetical protein